MSGIIEAVVEHIDSVAFIAVAVYGDDGQHLDDIVRPIENGETVLGTILDAYIAADMRNAEVRTNDEEIFKAVLPVAGLLPKITQRKDLTNLYRLFTEGTPQYEAIKDLYVTESVTAMEEAQQPKERRSLIPRLIAWLSRKLTKRGEIRND
jgi:hypothetical protein